MKLKSKKTILLIIAGLLLASGIVYYFFIHSTPSKDLVFVTPVNQLVVTDSGSINRYSGVVEAQQVLEYKLDSNKTLKSTNVQVGDSVKKGDVLFSYDSADIKLQIEDLRLQNQRSDALIESNNSQIEELNKQKESAGDDMQLEYSLQIQALQNDNLSESYKIKENRSKIAALQESLDNVDVLSDVDGVVKSINKSNDSDVYITVMENGEFLVKATINEMNIYQMSEGTRVTVYSRIDDKTWNGQVSKIDTDKTVENNNNYYYDTNAGGSDASSKYNFYVSLDDGTGLFLGQHVIVKPYSQGSKKGLWLSEFYIGGLNDGKPFIYKDVNGKIKKVELELGNYDSDNCEYEILSGLDINDYIAFPDENITEGSKTTTEYSDIVDDNPEMDDYPEIDDGSLQENEPQEGMDIVEQIPDDTVEEEPTDNVETTE